MSNTSYTIHGFKFHQYALDILKEEVYDAPKPLDASAIAVYIGLVSECSPAGILPRDFKKSKLAEKLNMTRQTVHDGFEQLLNRELIRLVETSDSTQIELYGYAAYNKSRQESVTNHAELNYFYVSSEIFNTPIIANLVKSKEAKGLLLLLSLFNHFYRELNKNKRDPRDAAAPRTLKYLKEALGKCSAIRVRKVLDMLSPAFSFVPEAIQERNCIKKAIKQIWVNKYNVHINPTFVAEKQETSQEQVEAAKALKDAHYRIKYMKQSMKQSDVIGINVAYRVIVREIARFVQDTKLQVKLLRESMQTALDNLETYIITSDKPIVSVGSFLNKQLQKYVFSFLDQHKIATDIMTHYYNVGAEIPTVLKKYQDHWKKRNGNF